jgi:hypothetical protein
MQVLNRDVLKFGGVSRLRDLKLVVNSHALSVDPFLSAGHEHQFLSLDRLARTWVRFLRLSPLAIARGFRV